jgi:hypothetical protein
VVWAGWRGAIDVGVPGFILVGAGPGDTRRTSPPATRAGALSLDQMKVEEESTQRQKYFRRTNAGAQTPFFFSNASSNSVMNKGVQGVVLWLLWHAHTMPQPALTMRTDALDAPTSQDPHAPAHAHDALRRDLRGQLAMPGPGPLPANRSQTPNRNRLNTRTRYTYVPCPTWTSTRCTDTGHHHAEHGLLLTFTP